MNDWYDAEQRVEKARQLFEQRKWLEALEELRAAIAINPYNSSWHFNIGLTLDQIGRLEQAIEAYRAALEIDADDVQALTHIGIDLYRTGRLHEALGSFQRLGELDPSYEPAYCHRIPIYADLGEHEKAEEMFYLARLYREQCPQCYYHIGCSLCARGLYDKAIFCWQKVLDLDEERPEVHVRIAEAYRKKGELEQSRRHYLIGLRGDPGNCAVVLDLGELLVEMGRLEDAGEKFRRAIEMAPESAAAYYALGRWLVRRGHEEQAIAAFERALRLDPTCAGAHLHLARVYQRRGDQQRMRGHLKAELQLRPEDPAILLDGGRLLLELDEPRAALACLKRLVGIEPAGADAWHNLALAYLLLGRYSQGIASERQALRRNRTLAAGLYNMALAHSHIGRHRRARAWARRALRSHPGDAGIQNLAFRLRLLDYRNRIGRILGGLLGR